MINKRQFILDSLLPYKLDSSKCGMNEYKSCLYLTKDGKKCAIGQYMKDGKWQEEQASIKTIWSEYRNHLKDVFTEDFLSSGLKLEEMDAMQQYHDNLAKDDIWQLRRSLKTLEILSGFEFPELRHEEIF